MSTMERRIWWAVLPAAVLPALSAIFYFVIATEGRVTQLVYSATKLFTLFWPLVAWRFILKRPIDRWDWRASRHWKALPLGLIVGLGIVGIAWIALATPLGDVVRANAHRIRAKTEAVGILRHYLLFSIFLSVFHSLIEEYYWRWFVYGRLAEVTRGPLPHLLAGAFFAAHHVVVLSTFFGLAWAFFFGGCVGIGGIIWSWLYQRQGSLLGIWLSHMIVDMGVLAIGYRVITG